MGPKPGQATIVPGHQIAEMALARLYTLTGEKKYLDEAKYLLDYRGKTHIRNPYSQSQAPILEQKEAVGHAVRAGYMYAGIADVAALTKDSAYMKVIDRIFENIVGKKYYLTGGVGARHAGEAFGENYELPNMTAIMKPVQPSLWFTSSSACSSFTARVSISTAWSVPYIMVSFRV